MFVFFYLFSGMNEYKNGPVLDLCCYVHDIQ